jgi:signal transduction histidine kinase
MRFVICTTKIDDEADVLRARGTARQICRLLGFDDNAQAAIPAEVCNMLRRSFANALGGAVEFAVEGAENQTLSVRAGLLDAACFRLEKPLPAVAVTDATLPGILDILSTDQPPALLEEVASQDAHLLLAMEQLETRQRELEQVNQELDDTNGGVMALYTELDERTQQLHRVSELKSRFLSNFSHEVRTPVNSILALSGILLNRLDGDLTAEQQKQVSFIRESAEQLSRLVNDELDMARVEAGKISLRLSDFQIGQVFSVLRGMFKPLLHNPAVSLIFEEPREIPALHSDEGKVGQILRNLIANALKFTNVGEVRISAQLTADGQNVAVTVADTGIGISPADQARIFQEFVQVGDDTARNEGAGIGLHLSQKLAGVLGGSLKVSSKLHEGAAFTATIPLVCPQVGLPVQASGVSRAGRSLLIIDDDRLSRYLVRQNLVDSGWRMVEAESGAEGLAMARLDRPDLIFLDVMLPDMNGFQVLRELKAGASTRTIPVVIFTSMPLTEAESHEFASDSAAILSKAEITTEVLHNMIRNLIPENSRRSAIQ